MPIINMGFYREGDKLIEGAYSPLETYAGKPMERPSYFLYETDHGCCIQEREHNGYHDSDFSMLIWNPETKSAYWYTFATTRAWCYPCYASKADATPEVLEQYHEWEKQRRLQWEREEKIKAVNKQRVRNAKDRAIAKLFSCDVAQVRKLYKFYQADFVETLYKFAQAKLRSEFRKSLQKQLIEWFQGKGKFDKPFSPKQVQYI